MALSKVLRKVETFSSAGRIKCRNLKPFRGLHCLCFDTYRMPRAHLAADSSDNQVVRDSPTASQLGRRGVVSATSDESRLGSERSRSPHRFRRFPARRRGSWHQRRGRGAQRERDESHIISSGVSKDARRQGVNAGHRPLWNVTLRAQESILRESSQIRR